MMFLLVLGAVAAQGSAVFAVGALEVLLTLEEIGRV